MQGERIPLRSQIKNHKIIVSEIVNKLGSVSEANKYLNKCLYYVNIGSDDYINNYFMPEKYPTSRIYNPEQFAEVLINQYSLEILVYISEKFIILPNTFCF